MGGALSLLTTCPSHACKSTLPWHHHSQSTAAASTTIDSPNSPLSTHILMYTIVLVHISSLAGTDITPIVPALEKIWRDSKGQSLADFNFRTVTSKFNELVYQYPIRCASCAGCAATLQCVATRSMSSCFHPDLPACSCHTALMLSLFCCLVSTLAVFRNATASSFGVC